LLKTIKDKVKATCRAFSQDWIEDPTNNNLTYYRNRIRYTLENEIYPLIPIQNFEKIMEDLLQVKKQFAKNVNAWVKTNVKLNWSFGYCIFNYKEFLGLQDSIAMRVLVRILQTLTGSFYPLFAGKLHGVIHNIKKGNRVTLGGCLFLHKQGSIFVCRELTKVTQMSIKMGQTVTWDGVFDIRMLPKEKNTSIIEAKITKLTDSSYTSLVTKYPHIRKMYEIIPPEVRKSIPVIVSNQNQLLSIPHLNLSTTQQIECKAVFNSPFKLTYEE
jgi:tRNA(Ile)-lysidine synthase